MKGEGVLESFYISISKKDAVLIFKDLNEIGGKDRIKMLPYFPYMAKIYYHNLTKQI